MLLVLATPSVLLLESNLCRGRMFLGVAMAMGGNFGVLPMNSMNSIVRIPIKDFIGLLTLTIVNSNVRSPMQSSTTKE